MRNGLKVEHDFTAQVYAVLGRTLIELANVASSPERRNHYRMRAAKAFDIATLHMRRAQA